MAEYSRGQVAQINKRIRLRGTKKFTARDKKCIICGHFFRGPACIHSVAENQEVLDVFTKEIE